MKKQVVASRFREDCVWLCKILPEDVELIIYNKGAKLDLPKSVRERASDIRQVRNVGREGHTYLHHIVENYNSLADVTLFTQAGASDHAGEKAILHYLDIRQNSQPESRMKLESTANSLKFTGWNPNFKKPPQHIRAATESPHWGAKKSALPFPAWWEKYVRLAVPSPKTVQFSWGGIFSVNSEYIKHYSKSYYKKLETSLSIGINPEEGHFLERAWSYIFNPKVKA